MPLLQSVVYQLLNEALAQVRDLHAGLRLDHIQELLDHGEPGIALENLCSNLHDEGLVVNAMVLRKLAEAGQHMGIDSRCWQGLRVI